MSTLRIVFVATALIAIAGCHDKNTPAPIAPQSEGVIPQAQLDALNKAKNVENVIMKDADRQREQADQQSQ